MRTVGQVIVDLTKRFKSKFIDRYPLQSVGTEAALALEVIRLDLSRIAGFQIAIVQRQGCSVFDEYDRYGIRTGRKCFYLEAPDGRRLGVRLPSLDDEREIIQHTVADALGEAINRFQAEAIASDNPPLVELRERLLETAKARSEAKNG